MVITAIRAFSSNDNCPKPSQAEFLPVVHSTSEMPQSFLEY
uniref:Uncharacterized protein n=1 Tax=Vibrio tasmaniensis TaxID=212663 RepID=A0A0H3ZZ10_9VIBR|nr:hypothetical protein [Vibrio tasmaniensis]